MTERIEEPTHEQLAAMETYRERVHALYRDVRSWLENDDRFRVDQSPASVLDGLGEYEVDRLRVFAGGECVADFTPIAATVILAEGRVDAIGLVDYAWLNYYEKTPTATTTWTRRDGTVTLHTSPIILGIDRPGWYWTDLRQEDGERFLDHDVLFELFEEISDLEGQPPRPLPGGPPIVPQNARSAEDPRSR